MTLKLISSKNTCSETNRNASLSLFLSFFIFIFFKINKDLKISDVNSSLPTLIYINSYIDIYIIKITVLL
ncbi:hypothetical protein BJ944DRAFT_67552 [Cunninghamella echinulata]|nr:hypothetical protein BJ944DRAFT_67552 [Cunninghamella echinulata]